MDHAPTVPRGRRAPSSRPLRSALALAGLLGSALAFSAASQPSAEGAAPGGSAMRVVIDPGHGGSDPGAAANGLVEKDLNLQVGLRLRELLELDTLDTSGGSEWEVMITRTTDVFISLGGRTTLANNWPADVFVSIHHNAFSSSLANGTETFSFTNGGMSALLRNDLQDEQLLAHGLNNRGPKTANFFVLRETNMPAVLSEAGFLTSPIDAATISAPGFIEDAARAHLFALQRYRGVAPHVPQLQPENYCVAKTSALGCVPTMGWVGEPSLSSSTPFEVVCQNVVSQQFGLMVLSADSAAIPFYGGTLCLGGNLIRSPIQFSFGFGTGDCSGRLTQELSGTYLQSLGFQAGDEAHAQFWFRDPYSPIQVGLSDGLRFRIMP